MIKLIDRNKIVEKISIIYLWLCIIIEILNIKIWQSDEIHYILIGCIITNFIYVIIWHIITIFNVRRFIRDLRGK